MSFEYTYLLSVRILLLVGSSVLVGLQAWASIQHLLCTNDLYGDKDKSFENPIAVFELLSEDL